MLGGRWTWSALAVAAALLVVVPAEQARAATCPFTSAPNRTVHTWDGSQDASWGIAANWDTNQVPNDNTTGDGTPETTVTFVCIPDSSTVEMDDVDLSNFSSNQVDVQAFWLGVGATIEIHPGVGLFTMSHTFASTVEDGGLVDVTSGFLGGEGTVRVHGDVSIAASSITGASSLISTPGTMPEGLQSRPGTLLVEQGGELSITNLGVGIRRGYRVQVLGTAELTGTGFIAADWGTAFLIGSTGVFDIANDAGYYQGFPVVPTLSDLVNGGLIRKSAGSGTSVIDADYVEVGAGTVEVQSGTLALPNGNTHPAQVDAANTLSTGQCAPRNPSDPCVLTTDPGLDLQSVSFRVPASDASGARVQVREEAGRVFTAHADDLVTPPTDPAVISMRMGQSVAGTSDPSALEVVHVDDRGVQHVLGPCPSVGLPVGVTNCVDTTASVWDGANVYKVVRTTDTSRYICRKDDTEPPVFLAAPASAKPKVKLGKPVVVSATINEAGTISVFGKVKVKGIRVKGVSVLGEATAVPGELVTVKLKLTKKQKRKLSRAGAEKGKMFVTVTAIDKRGNETTFPKFSVKLT